MFEPSERIALAALDRPAREADWLALVEAWRETPGFWWLDSARRDGRLGSLSFAGADPYLWLQARGASLELEVTRRVRPGLATGARRVVGDPIDAARALLPRADSLLYSTRRGGRSASPDWRSVAGLSDALTLPFLGGAVGFFGYELAGQLEPSLSFRTRDDLGLPDLALAFVDHVLAFDHEAERFWLVGLGFGDGRAPSQGGARGQAIARSRALVDELEQRVERILRSPSPASPPPRDPESNSSALESSPEESLELRSTCDAAGYAKSVDRILEEIGRGNVYQANFSQRLTVETGVDPWALYTRLRRVNPAPFGAWLRLPDGTAILSSSPERFLRVDAARSVESRPIKGTRPRGATPAEDARLADGLVRSPKDRAENLMIVDLVRNDLGRVCQPGSIAVPELMQIERYAAVLQMVSTVTGRLATGRDAFDLIEASFPPGSMTGAPKLASMALLDRLESVRRGVFAGALGYLDLRGGLDLSVVIRTFVCQPGRVHLHVGGGVVADSSPEGEYLESLDKARAPLAALAAAEAEAVSEETGR